MLAHDNVLAGVGSFHRIIQPMEHRLVSLLPLSHSLEQAVSPVLRDGRRGGHPLRPVAQPAGHLRQPPRAPGHDDAPRPPGARPVLERDRARGREAGPHGDVRAPARVSPAVPPLPGATASCSATSTSSSAAGCACSRPPARSCRPRSSRRGRTWASSSSRATARPRPRPARARRWPTTRWAASAGPRPPVEMRIADDGEIQFRGPTLFKGYWNNPEATAAAYTDDGWYKSGDLGQLDEQGRLHLHGRKQGHHRPAQRVQRVPGGPRERAPRRRHPRFGRARDESPGGSRRSCSGRAADRPRAPTRRRPS